MYSTIGYMPSYLRKKKMTSFEALKKYKINAMNDKGTSEIGKK